jgi:hypothetical protein
MNSNTNNMLRLAVIDRTLKEHLSNIEHYNRAFKRASDDAEFWEKLFVEALKIEGVSREQYSEWAKAHKEEIEEVERVWTENDDVPF